MNFQDLYKKIAALDENLESSDFYTEKDKDVDVDETSVSSVDQPLMDTDMEECGGMMSPMASMSSSKQQDSVSMTVNMNGSGAGGIRDLMSILKNIEQGDDSGKAMVVGMEEFANEPEAKIADVDAVTPRGTDLHSNFGDHDNNRQAGPLPVASPVREGLIDQLNNLYQEVKSR